ncbi:MAG: hypothetical protein IH960_08680 [Chloroflexi bacterium]|nr:hypothetical protein [Chloroflexota bacterium]
MATTTVVGVGATGACVAVGWGAAVGNGDRESIVAGGSSELHATAAKATTPNTARNIVIRREINNKIKS